MQEVFDFFDKLSDALGTIEQKAVESTAQAAESGGKEELDDFLQKIRTARNEVAEALTDEKKRFAEEEAIIQRISRRPPEPEIPAFEPPPAPPEPAPDPTCGSNARQRLLDEFVAKRRPKRAVPVPSGATFESWIDSSVSLAPSLFGDLRQPDEFARQVHRRATTLGVRESIWWACVATYHVCDRISIKLPVEQLRQVGAASNWVAGRSAEGEAGPISTGSIETVGDAIGLALALANNRFPSGAAQFEQPQDAAAAAILLACRLVRHDLLPVIQSEVLNLGAEIGAGRLLWPDTAKGDSSPSFEGGWSSWMKDSNG